MGEGGSEGSGVGFSLWGVASRCHMMGVATGELPPVASPPRV